MLFFSGGIERNFVDLLLNFEIIKVKKVKPPAKYPKKIFLSEKRAPHKKAFHKSTQKSIRREKLERDSQWNTKASEKN